MGMEKLNPKYESKYTGKIKSEATKELLRLCRISYLALLDIGYSKERAYKTIKWPTDIDILFMETFR